MKTEEVIREKLTKLETDLPCISSSNPNIKAIVEHEIFLLKWVLDIKVEDKRYDR